MGRWWKYPVIIFVLTLYPLLGLKFHSRMGESLGEFITWALIIGLVMDQIEVDKNRKIRNL